MRELNKYELDNWFKIRRKGRVLYALRWVFYYFIFFIFLQGVLILLNRKSINDIEIIAISAISVTMGIATAMIRWAVFEKKYRSKGGSI